MYRKWDLLHAWRNEVNDLESLLEEAKRMRSLNERQFEQHLALERFAALPDGYVPVTFMSWDDQYITIDYESHDPYNIELYLAFHRAEIAELRDREVELHHNMEGSEWNHRVVNWKSELANLTILIWDEVDCAWIEWDKETN